MWKTALSGLAVLTAAAMPFTAQAQGDFNGIRVLVAADDADKKSVVRSSDIYHRIQIPLNDEMNRFGYETLFQDAVAAELDWPINDRADKRQSIQMMKDACTSNKATLCPRVLVLVKTRASAVKRSHGGLVAEVRMTGELIDASTNAYIGGWEAPTLDFPAPAECNSVCIENVVGDNARKVALNLADTLRKKLDAEAIRPAAVASNGAVTGGAATGVTSGLVNNYVYQFERFQMDEILPMQAIIEGEFPGTEQITQLAGGSGYFSFNASSRAPASKMFTWLHQMMDDRGYNRDNIKITASGDGTYIIERIVDDGYRPARPRRVYE
ncbi:MAG: hypothetical protein AAF996_04760 [Pseudomonadota bacterium]